MSELPQLPPPRCIHLQSKAMAVYGEGFESDPDFQDGMTDSWCVMTGRPLGPDNGEVGLKPCSDPDRDCYQEY
ncbi:MAG: hypothetical protein J2P46_14975 [Zavarzinella sp.]|nr:hypothetical protein [Zavarzinella sp.]